MKMLKHESAKLFNNILINCSVTPMVNNLESSKLSQQTNVEKFVKLCCEALEYKRFLCFFEETFNMSEQVDLVFQLSDKCM